MDKKKVLVYLIKAGRNALHLEKTLNDIGFKETPIFDLHGDIADAVYHIIDEKTDTFDESITYAAMHDIYTTDEICAENLASMVPDEIEWDIPEATLNVIEEAAAERKLDVSRMVNLILSEWAMKESMIKHQLRI